MSYQGLEAIIPLGEYGMIASDSPLEAPRGSLYAAGNISYERGGVARGRGWVRYNSTAMSGSPAVRAIAQYDPLFNVSRLLVAGDNGNVYRDNGAYEFPHIVKSGLDARAVTSLCVAGRELLGRDVKVFLANGQNMMQVITGDELTMRDIASATRPAEWVPGWYPLFVFSHANRLWTVVLDRLYYTQSGDHENWTGSGAGSLSIGIGVGVHLMGAITFKEFLFLWKWPEGIFVMDTSSTDPANWTVKELNRTIGLATPHGVALAGDEVYFVSQFGHLHALSRIVQGDIVASDVFAATKMVRIVESVIDVSTIGLVRSYLRWYAKRKELHWACRIVGSGWNNADMVLDFNRPEGSPRLRLDSKGKMIESLLVGRGTTEHVLVAGDNAGRLWGIDDANLSIDGASYTSVVATHDDDFGWVDPRLSTRRKSYHWIEMIAETLGNYEVECKVFIDTPYPAPTPTETLYFRMLPYGGAGSTLGGLVLGTNNLASGLTIRAVRRRLHGTGRRIRFELRVTTAGQDFVIARLVVGFKADGERHATL